MDAWDLMLDLLRTALFSLSHMLGGSLGFAIVTLSAVVRLALLPVTLRGARRGLILRQKMAAIKPELVALQKKHGKDPEKLRAAMLELYARNGIRPIRDSGLGSVFLQLPIGIALYSVIRQGIGVGSKFLWIGNLARSDILLSVVTSALTATMTLSAPTMSGGEPNRGFAVAFAVLTFFMVWQIASGVTLYWASTTSIGILQNLILRREKLT
jgi:YidC/Oxa1 family membrane protein insertase